MKFDVNIYVVKYFVTVAEIGNITNAAEQLFITQPTLSRQISNLEDALKVKLFRRVKSGVELTDAGKMFYEQCKKLIAAYDEFSSKAFEFQNVIVGTLNIAHQKASEDLSLYCHQKFLKAYPNVVIKNHRQEPGKNLVTALTTGELHLAYIYGNELKKKYMNIKSIQVDNMKNMLVVSTNSPFASRESVSFEELHDQRFVMPSRLSTPYKYEQIMNACYDAGFSPDIVSSVDSFFDYILEVVIHNGVAILPYIRSVAETTSQIKYIPLTGYECDYPIHLAWSTTNTNPLIHTYLNFIKSLLAESSIIEIV